MESRNDIDTAGDTLADGAENLVNGTRSGVRRVADTVAAAASATKEKAADLAGAAADALGTARARTGEALDDAKAWAVDAAETAEVNIMVRPYTSMAAALGFGIAVGYGLAKLFAPKPSYRFW